MAEPGSTRGRCRFDAIMEDTARALLLDTLVLMEGDAAKARAHLGLSRGRFAWLLARIGLEDASWHPWEARS